MKTAILDHYDWIILGDHPAALWASLTLLEAGQTVLVVPRLAEVFEDGAHLHEPNWCPSFVSDDLPSERLIQVLTPQRRFKIATTPEAFQEEWRNTFDSTVKPEQFDDPRLHDLVKGLGFVYRGHDLGTLLPDDWKRILTKVMDQRYFPTGNAGLKQMLKDKIEKAGGRVLEHNFCQQIFAESKGFKGIQLQGISKMIAAKNAILSVNWDWAQTYFSQSSTSMKSDPMGWWFTLQLKIPNEMMPIGATAKMIYAEKNAPVVEIEQMRIDHHHQTQDWEARTILPYHSLSLSRDYQRKIAQRLFKLLEGIFPFLEYGATDLMPDIRDPEQVEEFDLVQLYPFRDLSHIPPQLLVYGGKGIGHLSPFPGLYLAYEESYPRHGDAGAYHAAASAVMDWAKKSQIVLSDTIKKALIT